MYFVKLAESIRDSDFVLQNIVIPVNTLKQASQTCRNFIKKHNLGASTWAGGELFDRNGKQVAVVSYNGRIWNMKNQEISLEN